MCGRFTLTISKNDLIKALENDFSIDFSLEYKEKYNIAPTEDIVTVIFDGQKYRAGYLKWGLAPFLNKSQRIINVRSETVLQKKLFKDLIITNKILIPADGFYEWDKRTKTPYRFISDNNLFYFAGIWSKFKTEDNKTIYTGAILTQEANNFISQTHDRMPVVFSHNQLKLWLKEKDPKVIKDLLISDNLKFSKYEVSKAVNNALNKDKSLIEPVS